MKIGLVQFAPLLGDLDGTIKKLDGILAGKDLPDLLVLPELCNSGYNFTSPQQALETSEEIEDSTFLNYLQTVCSEHKIHIVSGFNEKENNKLFNASVLVGPAGILGVYRKLHLFMNEKDFFQPGNLGLPVFDIGLCKLGMLVCFDWTFPEVWRVLTLKSADIICHPSNLVLPGLAQRGVPVHALTNRIFTITANRVGTEGNLTFTGLSTVADPKGDILMQASETGEEFHTVEINISLARNKQITPRNNVLTDRRPEEYALLIEKSSIKS
jgi:predicted amidohydrolase